MLNLHSQQHRIVQTEHGWNPIQVSYKAAKYPLSVMSIAFLLEKSDDAVIWRGPKKNSMITQFIQNVDWKGLDFVIIDTPPGTSDEHLSVLENLAGKLKGAVIVTTPQNVALSDVRKEITFCRQLNVPIIGLVENMSGFTCSKCHGNVNIFSKGGGQMLAEEAQLSLLGTLPIDKEFIKSVESGSILDNYHNSSMHAQFKEITNKVLNC